MSKVPAGDDVEEAKVEVEYDEPTDEREIHDSTITTTTSVARTSDPSTKASVINVPEANSHVENTGDVKKDDDDDGGVKQIKMTVAADAPWKDRLWEGP